MSIQRCQEVEVLDNGVTPIVPKMSRQQRRYVEARVRKIQTLGAMTQQVAAMHETTHERVMEETRQGIVHLNGHDAWVGQLGPEAAQTHAVVKGNYHQTQMGLLQRLNQETLELLEDLLDEVMSLPDGRWYDHSLADRINAFLDDTSLELEDRGLPRLSLGEQLRELLLGDVVGRKVAAHDQEQARQRQRQREQARELETARLYDSLPGGVEEAVALPQPQSVDQEASPLTPDELETLLQTVARRRSGQGEY